MKLHCNTQTLLQHLNIVTKAVSNRTTLPILECILLTADDTGLTLTANDLEMGIQTAPIAAETLEKGEVAIEAKIFNEIVRKLAGDMISISVDERHAVNIVCGGSEFTIMGQSGEEFPVLPEVKQEHAYQMSQVKLKDMIRQTLFSIAQDNTKPALTGELFEFREDAIRLVSVDGYRISYRKADLVQSHEALDVIVPGKTLAELNKILHQEEDAMVTLYLTDKHILFDLGNATVVSRLIAGNFIRYEQSFSSDYRTKVIVNKQELIQSLERASLVSRDSKKTPVHFLIEQGMMTMSAKSDMGTAQEALACDVEGDALQIAFNPRYFIEALRSIDDELVKIHFTATLSPCTILPVEADDYKYLILPLRI